MSPDDLEMYFVSTRAGGLGFADLWISRRASPSDPWGPPVNVGPPVNGPWNEMFPSLSPDGLTLYFSDFYPGMNAAANRPGGLGGPDIWMSTRASRNAPWGEPVNVGPPINSSGPEVSVTLSRDGLTLVFGANRAGGSGNYDLWMSSRATMQDPWGPPVNLGPNVNSASLDAEPSLSADRLVLFFSSTRSGGIGNYDVWMTRRKSLNDPWEPAVNLGPEVNSAGQEGGSSISPDGQTLYFVTATGKRSVPIIPVVDFDGDGLVAMGDLLRLIESWGKDDPVCDIGPAPWGDGVVDAADLEVLMSYWGQDVYDPTLIAHWKLDEAEGVTAHETVRGNNDLVMGGPLWQPTGGKVNGAIELDGADDCIISTFGMSPAGGPFSVLAWIKGGAPGQVIISQATAADWLMADVGGKLMTELKSSDRLGGPLQSQTVITDGNWHRIALVWDGSHRTLCVDGIAVAEDAQSALEGSQSALYIGVGKNYASGSFWSGLIDDVRIYSRAVKASSKW